MRKNSDAKWEKQVDLRTYVFKKSRVKAFLYSCEIKGIDTHSVTRFLSLENLTRGQAERVPKFVSFISAKI
jgi:hypothetical protein